MIIRAKKTFVQMHTEHNIATRGGEITQKHMAPLNKQKKREIAKGLRTEQKGLQSLTGGTSHGNCRTIHSREGPRQATATSATKGQELTCCP